MRFVLFKKDQSDPSHIDVHYGEETFKIAVRRSPKARRVTLRISRTTGDLSMTLPQRLSLEMARRFAESHKDWIAARLHSLPETVTFDAGAIIPVRGVPHRIERRINLLTRSGLLKTEDGERIILVGGEEPHCSRRVRELLKREALHDIKQSVARYTTQLCVHAQKITLRDTRSRWGSCSSRGDLSFSWRLIMAPPEILDYLVAHEVAHLVEMNHSHRFWSIVHDICPHTDQAELWLKQHGSNLHRYG